MSNALQVLEQQFLERKAEFLAVLPNNCTFEKFSRIVKTATIQNQDLMIADRPSLFMSCFRCAQDGLLPDGRESALVIYNTKQKDGSYKKAVQYMPMIAGILKKIRNSGEIKHISTHVVYEKDIFDYCLGDEEFITHKPAMGDRGEPICAYAIVKTKDDATYREVMSVTEINRIRNYSKQKDGAIWKDHWSEMARKTVLRRLSKWLPMSSDLEILNAHDQDYDFEISPKNAIPTALETLNALNKKNSPKEVIDITDLDETENNTQENELVFKEEPLIKNNGKSDE